MKIGRQIAGRAVFMALSFSGVLAMATVAFVRLTMLALGFGLLLKIA